MDRAASLQDGLFLPICLLLLPVNIAQHRSSGCTNTHGVLHNLYVRLGLSTQCRQLNMRPFLIVQARLKSMTVNNPCWVCSCKAPMWLDRQGWKWRLWHGINSVVYDQG